MNLGIWIGVNGSEYRIQSAQFKASSKVFSRNVNIFLLGISIAILPYYIKIRETQFGDFNLTWIRIEIDGTLNGCVIFTFVIAENSSF